MSKTKRFLLVDIEGDIAVHSEQDLLLTVKDPEALKDALGEKASWFSVQLKPATAGRDREITAKTLTHDPVAGFRSNPLLLPGARIEVMLEGWSWEGPVSKEAADDLPPSLADAIDIAIQMHLRPSAFRDADFLAAFSANGKP